MIEQKIKIVKHFSKVLTIDLVNMIKITIYANLIITVINT